MFKEEEIKRIEKERMEWTEKTKDFMEQKKEFVTPSGIKIKNIYTPEDIKGLDYVKDIGFPGVYPNVRGVYPTMYRGQPWTIRMFSGFGTPEETNKRWRLLYEEGETGFSAACDVLTFNGIDPDDPEVDAQGEVGTSGTPLYSIKAVEEMIKDLPIDKVTVALVVECMTATSLTSMYFNAAKKRGYSLNQIGGTTQNDIGTMLIGYITRNSLKPDVLLKLACDLIEYCIPMKNAPRWNPINFTTYNYREGGIDAVQEIAFGFTNAIDHIDELLRRGWEIDEFAHRLAFHLSADRHFFEEIAKYRAARRIWAKLMTERYGAKNPQSIAMKYHVQTAGSSLANKQPMVNIIRTTIQGLEAVLGGTQSMHTNSWDEAICLPSDEAVKLAVKTQQVIREETGVTDTIDPLAGSYYVEWLTNEMEKRILSYMGEIEAQGGFVKALENGWIFNEMTKAFHKRQRAIASGEEKFLGINCFTSQEESTIIPFRTNPKAAEIEIERLKKLRKERNNNRVTALLDELRRVCERKENVMPKVMELTAEGATLGEITKVYRQIFGVWELPIAV